MTSPSNPRRPRPVYNEALGRAIKVLRTELGIERRDLADSAGISYSYLAEIENGNKPPSSQVLLALSDALGVRPSELHAAADSLPERFDGSQGSRQSQIAQSLRHRVAASRMAEPMNVHNAMSTDDDRQAKLDQFRRLLDRMADDDLDIIIELARRLGR